VRHGIKVLLFLTFLPFLHFFRSLGFIIDADWREIRSLALAVGQSMRVKGVGGKINLTGSFLLSISR
jgi:hypothetical protein